MSSRDFGIANEKIKVLVLDDDRLSCQALQNIMYLEDYDTVCLENPTEGLNALDSTEFDLVILDIVLPVIDGFELCKNIRERFNMFELPIIMLTGKNKTEDIIKGFQAGANDYVLKPFERGELISRIKAIISLKRAVKESLANRTALKNDNVQRLVLDNVKDILISSTLDIETVMSGISKSVQNIIACEFLNIVILNYNSFEVITKFGNLEVEIDGHILRELKNNLYYTKGNNTYIALRYREEDIGFIVYRNNQVIDEASFNILIAVITQGAVAIKNAMLFDEVKRLATLDSLTGLLNRRYFLELAERSFMTAKRYKREFTVMMIDIDDFKLINDKYGHDLGDSVIKLVSRVIVDRLRTVDLVGRYGGEEFVVILPETCKEGAISAAHRIREAISSEIISVPENEKVSCTVSIGVAAFGEQVALVDMIKEADVFLYKAKKNGRNRVEG